MDSCGLFCALKNGSQFLGALRKIKRGMLNAKKKDHYKIWRGRIPDGGYSRRVQDLLPPVVAEEGAEEPGGNGGE